MIYFPSPLDDSFNLGLKFELVLEVRARVASGIMLHVYTDQKDFLSMYMHQGEVCRALWLPSAQLQR